jgi:hypothetical protein
MVITPVNTIMDIGKKPYVKERKGRRQRFQ